MRLPSLFTILCFYDLVVKDCEKKSLPENYLSWSHEGLDSNQVEVTSFFQLDFQLLSFRDIFGAFDQFLVAVSGEVHELKPDQN